MSEADFRDDMARAADRDELERAERDLERRLTPHAWGLLARLTLAELKGLPTDGLPAVELEALEALCLAVVTDGTDGPRARVTLVGATVMTSVTLDA